MKRALPLLMALIFLLGAAAEAKPKKAKKKGYDYEASKYKAVVEDKDPAVYRFDEKGNPIIEKKKAPAKKKKAKALPPDEGGDAEKDCKADDSCKQAPAPVMTKDEPAPVKPAPASYSY